MLVYVDTSCIVKLYAEEPGAQEARYTVQSADRLACSWIGYVEVQSALSRHLLEKHLALSEFRRIQDVFATDWNWYAKIPISPELIHQAGLLTRKHNLRALDAIHLASALACQKEVEEPVTFLSYDQPLCRAAKKEKLTLAS